LNEEIKLTKTSLLIEQKTKGLPTAKKEFIAKILGDKTPEYIKENFNYVVDMFEREDRKIATNLAKTATQTAVTKDAKVPTQTITESVKTEVLNPYVDALKTFR